MTDVDDWDDYYRDDEPGEPDWGYWDESPSLTGRERRRVMRRRRHQQRVLRKIQRHARDRFWLARNWREIERQARGWVAFDDMAPF